MAEPPLSDDEILQLRHIIEHDKRMAWLWAGMRRWAAWVSGGIIAAYGTYDAIWKFIFRPKGS